MATPGSFSSSYSSLRLHEFWLDTPADGFVHAESKFWLEGITAETERYDHLVGVLPCSSVCLVLDVLERPNGYIPYTALKQGLPASHEWLDFQGVEKLFQMEPLGTRKPSELLREMLELCPRDQENTTFFMFLFLQWLPKEIGVFMDEAETFSRRDLAVTADCLWVQLLQCWCGG